MEDGENDDGWWLWVGDVDDDVDDDDNDDDSQ